MNTEPPPIAAPHSGSKESAKAPSTPRGSRTKTKVVALLLVACFCLWWALQITASVLEMIPFAFVGSRQQMVMAGIASLLATMFWLLATLLFLKSGELWKRVGD